MDYALLLVGPVAVFIAIGLGFAHVAKSRAMAALTTDALVSRIADEDELPVAA